jgi:hypothetical protein
MKVKIFTDDNVYDLEKKMNAWFRMNRGIEIIGFTQSESNAVNTNDIPATYNFGVTITILYRDK